MSQILAWILQGLILTAGIFFFLRIIRITRGSRIIRGMVVALVGGTLILWGLSEALKLDELAHIIEIVAGFVVVIFVILFQPELRRAIAQLGEGGILNRLMKNLGRDSVSELCQAVVAMAARRQGALIAIERENPLDAYIEGGVRVDAAVGRLLLESIFHPGSSLHDGAVILRKERIAAAACLFPLTENLRIARSTGTRHRAALGLTDETDAVTIAVSEETGGISICKRGRMQTVTPGKLEEILRESLGPEDAQDSPADERRFSQIVAEFARGDLVWLAASVFLAVALILFAHQRISGTDRFTVAAAGRPPGSTVEPGQNQLLIVLPSEDYKLVSITPRPLQVEVRATRGQLNQIRFGIRGVLELEEPLPSEPFELEISEVRWQHEQPGVSYHWSSARVPTLRVEHLARRVFRLSPANLNVDHGDLPPRYEVDLERATFEPEVITVVGPAREIGDLGGKDQPPLELEPLVLKGTGTTGSRERLRLSEDLVARGYSIEGDGAVQVTLPIKPIRWDLGLIRREIALVCMDPTRTAELERWTLPSGSAKDFHVYASGLIPADPGSEAFREFSAQLTRFVDENLNAFVDIQNLPRDGDARAVPIEWRWRKSWLESAGTFGLDPDTLNPRERLYVELAGGEKTIRLVARTP